MRQTTETVEMLVRVKVRYNTKTAKRNAMAAIRKHLYVEYWSAGVDGFFYVESGRVKLATAKVIASG